MKYFHGNDLQVFNKGELGPVTAADRDADSLLSHGIASAFPDDGLLTEEGSLCRDPRSGRRWFVDPIDGTREFISKRTDFAVMIGLCVDGSPHLGVVLQPATGELAWGVVGQGAWLEDSTRQRQPLIVSPHNTLPQARVVRSFSHPSAAVDAFCLRTGAVAGAAMGSFGLKCVEVAKGNADLYLNLSSKTALWDSAGPAAIVLSAGGQVTTPEGDLVDYRDAPTFHPTGTLVTNALLHYAAVLALSSMRQNQP
jgi:3'(2'), 5'-bisphosphate nucleotidase